ncbi:MAG: hypothetical protein PSW75_12995 [bacterium]|nr:hypothetical protein [bacterium]MDI1336845.1 hypothetical protein [Lacunisphaera sp.]
MTETKIKAALIRFTAGIKNSDGPGISAALSDVEALLAAHRGELPPQLVHFLEGRSYAKALAYLGGDSGFAKPASPPGGCGGGHA